MANKDKVDLFKEHRDEYSTSKKPVLVDVKEATYLVIEGRGEPGGEEFQLKIGALYAVAYTLKMRRKFAGKQDYVVGKLEGQWWGEGGESELSDIPMDGWCWQLMIRTPDFVGRDELEEAVSVLLEKSKEQEVREVALRTMTEGRCVQMLHVGPYENEGETVALMKRFASENGLEPHGRHHEIYLSDPRRVPPERLKTILRMPVKR